MTGNKSPWGNGNGNKGGKSPWGSSGGKPDRSKPGAGENSPDLDNVIEGFKTRMRSGGGGGGGRSSGGAGPNMALPRWLILGAVVLFLGVTMTYTVDQQEEALILRFGKYHKTAQPGLNFKLPPPVDTLIKRKTRVVNKIDIGGSPRTSLMLTGDENIVDIDFTVLWRISDLKSYEFNVDRTAGAVRAVAESAMREIVGRNELEKIISTDRLSITNAVRDLMQSTLDEYEAGVEVVEVQLQKSDTPTGSGGEDTNVIAAYRDVVNAEQDAETFVNEATAIQNSIVPQARGEAAQIIQDAEAYKGKVVAEATGEAERFRLVYEEYKAAPRVTRQRMYLETLEVVYGPADKIILDESASDGVVPYLPLDQLNRKKGGQ